MLLHHGPVIFVENLAFPQQIVNFLNIKNPPVMTGEKNYRSNGIILIIIEQQWMISSMLVVMCSFCSVGAKMIIL